MNDSQDIQEILGQPLAFVPRREVAGPRRYYPLGTGGILEWHTPGRPPEDRQFITLAEVGRRAERECPLPPEMFIFHCGRCGSTLLGRLLEVDPANRVLLEPNALQRFLERARDPGDGGEIHADLKAMVAAYGFDPSADERRLVIKLSSISILDLDLVRACFPAATFVYLFRDPAEVVGSELRGLASFLGRGKRAELGARFAGLTRRPDEYSDLEWCAWYVDRNLRHAWRSAAAFARGIDYSEHRTAYLEVLNATSERTWHATDPAIAAILGTYSKRLGTPFSASDDAAKTSPELRREVDPITREAYQLWRERSRAG